MTIYFNHALQQLREEIGKEPIDVKDINAQWAERMKSKLPDEMVYADHWDFITELDLKKERIYKSKDHTNKQKSTSQ